MQSGGPHAGQVVGEYLLDALIGRGATGEVWRAHHHVWTSRVAAIKIPTNPEFLRAIRQEGILHEDLSRLESPHIVRVFGLNVMTNPPYLAMEYVAGSDLRKRLKNSGKQPLAEALRILEGVLKGLALAHERGIVHRDIKPENVLLDETGTPKLTDFSIAIVSPSADSLRMSIETDPGSAPSLAGTLVYMSPEQRQGVPAGPRSDVFSMGIMLFEMLTGELPQPGDRLGDFVPGIPQAVESFFQSCFTRQDRRFSNAREMLNAVQALRAGHTPLMPASLAVAAAQAAGASLSGPAQRKTAKINLSTRDMPRESTKPDAPKPEAAAAQKSSVATPEPVVPVLSTRSLDAVRRTSSVRAAVPPPPAPEPAPPIPAPPARQASTADARRAHSGSAASQVPAPARIEDVARLLDELPEDSPAGTRHALSDPRPSRQYDEQLPTLQALYRQHQTAAGISHFTAGRFSDAEGEFRRLLTQDTRDVAARKGLAMSLFRQGKPKEALRAYREILEASPDLAEVWNNVGVISLSLGKLREAEKALLRAVELRPRYASAHSNLGAVYQQQGRVDEARKEAAIALELDPDNPAAGFNASI